MPQLLQRFEALFTDMRERPGLYEGATGMVALATFVGELIKHVAAMKEAQG